MRERKGKKMKKRILLLGTGGTIACKETKSGLAPMITAEELISFVPEAAGLCEIETEQKIGRAHV